MPIVSVHLEKWFKFWTTLNTSIAKPQHFSGDEQTTIFRTLICIRKTSAATIIKRIESLLKVLECRYGVHPGVPSAAEVLFSVHLNHGSLHPRRPIIDVPHSCQRAWKMSESNWGNWHMTKSWITIFYLIIMLNILIISEMQISVWIADKRKPLSGFR